MVERQKNKREDKKQVVSDEIMMAKILNEKNRSLKNALFM